MLEPINYFKKKQGGGEIKIPKTETPRQKITPKSQTLNHLYAKQYKRFSKTSNLHITRAEVAPDTTGYAQVKQHHISP